MLASNMIALNKQRQNNDSGLFNYEYDSLNRLTQVSKDNNFISGYEYDGKNNRTKYVTTDNTTEYLYNDNSQLIKTVDNNSIKEYEYYLSGNVKQVIEDNKVIKEYKYNIDNRLIEAKSPKGVVAFSYNSLNKLVAKTSNQEKTDYIIDHLKPFNEVITSKTNKTSIDYLYDATGLVSENNDIALLDHLGTPTTLMNNNDITTQRTFNEFGISNDIQDNEIGYTGYLYDEESQLNYAQARFYNPEDARFNGLDNIVNFDETPIGFNRYAYVMNNPKKYVDKDGNIPLPVITGGIGAFVGGGIGLYKGIKSGKTGWDLVKSTGKGALKGGVYGAVAGGTFGVAALSGSYSGVFTGGVSMVVDSGVRIYKGKKITAESLMGSYLSGFVGGSTLVATRGAVVGLSKVSTFIMNSYRGSLAGLFASGTNSLLDSLANRKSLNDTLGSLATDSLFGMIFGKFGVFVGSGNLAGMIYDFVTSIFQDKVENYKCEGAK